MAANRIRVSLSSSELEVEGDADFVAKYDETLEPMLKRLRNAKTPAPADAGAGGGAEGVAAAPVTPGEFGEALHAFSNSANVTDQMLLAGSHVQAGSADKAFTTGQANQLLIEQGIKVGNPSQCMTNNLKAKRVFKIPGNKYRVSKQGAEHLQKLRG